MAGNKGFLSEAVRPTIRGRYTADGAIPFGNGVELGTYAEDQVQDLNSANIVGVAVEDATKGALEAGAQTGPTQYEDGDLVKVLRRGVVNIQPVAHVIAGEKVAVVDTAGNSGFSVGDFVGENTSMGTGNATTIQAEYVETIPADGIGAAEFNLPG